MALTSSTHNSEVKKFNNSLAILSYDFSLSLLSFVIVLFFAYIRVYCISIINLFVVYAFATRVGVCNQQFSL